MTSDSTLQTPDPKRVLIATTNQGKMKGLLDGFHGLLGIEFLSLKDFPRIPDVEETGTTFAENAFQKAQYYADFFGIPTLGEDSGILVSAFPDAFGIHSRRQFGDAGLDDMIWLEKFLDMLDGHTDRSARFVSTLTYYDPDTKKYQTFVGEMNGTIMESPQCPIAQGVPASSVFLPDGADVVHGALSPEKKQIFSHRGIAVEKMKAFLETL